MTLQHFYNNKTAADMKQHPIYLTKDHNQPIPIVIMHKILTNRTNNTIIQHLSAAKKFIEHNIEVYDI